MSVRRQVLCKQCGASHLIRRQLRPGVIYRFFCKACGAFVSFDRSQVRWATSDRALRSSTRTRPEEPRGTAHDTVVERPAQGRRIWQATTLAPSDDMRATLDGVQGIWRKAEPAPQPARDRARPTRLAVAPLPETAPELPIEIEVTDADIVDATDVTEVADAAHAVADAPAADAPAADTPAADAPAADAPVADDGLTTIADQRPPVHVTPLLRPRRLEVTPVESTRVRWLRRMLRRGAA